MLGSCWLGTLADIGQIIAVQLLALLQVLGTGGLRLRGLDWEHGLLRRLHLSGLLLVSVHGLEMDVRLLFLGLDEHRL